MTDRIGINGFGRMGRLALRAALDRLTGASLGFTRINEIACDAAGSAHLLQFDSVQAAAPGLLRRGRDGTGPNGGTARIWAAVLAPIPAGIALGMVHGPALAPALATWLTALTGLELGGLVPTAAVQVQGAVLVGGLVLFGIVFAINSAVHSYLILAYSDFQKVSMNVGFYYTANARWPPRRHRAVRARLSDPGLDWLPVVVGGLCGGGLPALVAFARRASIVGTSGVSPYLTPF